MKLFNKTKMTAVALIMSITVLFSTSASVCAATTDTKEGKLPAPSAETQSNNGIMPLGSNTLYLGGSNAFTSVPVSFGAAGGRICRISTALYTWQLPNGHYDVGAQRSAMARRRLSRIFNR